MGEQRFCALEWNADGRLIRAVAWAEGEDGAVGAALDASEAIATHFWAPWSRPGQAAGGWRAFFVSDKTPSAQERWEEEHWLCSPSEPPECGEAGERAARLARWLAAEWIEAERGARARGAETTLERLAESGAVQAKPGRAAELLANAREEEGRLVGLWSDPPRPEEEIAAVSRRRTAIWAML
jgi:hypothetical protein